MLEESAEIEIPGKEIKIDPENQPIDITTDEGRTFTFDRRLLQLPSFNMDAGTNTVVYIFIPNKKKSEDNPSEGRVFFVGSSDRPGHEGVYTLAEGLEDNLPEPAWGGVLEIRKHKATKIHDSDLYGEAGTYFDQTTWEEKHDGDIEKAFIEEINKQYFD